MVPGTYCPALERGWSPQAVEHLRSTMPANISAAILSSIQWHSRWFSAAFNRGDIDGGWEVPALRRAFDHHISALGSKPVPDGSRFLAPVPRDFVRRSAAPSVSIHAAADVMGLTLRSPPIPKEAPRGSCQWRLASQTSRLRSSGGFEPPWAPIPTAFRQIGAYLRSRAG